MTRNGGMGCRSGSLSDLLRTQLFLKSVNYFICVKHLAGYSGEAAHRAVMQLNGPHPVLPEEIEQLELVGYDQLGEPVKVIGGGFGIALLEQAADAVITTMGVGILHIDYHERRRLRILLLLKPTSSLL